MVAALRSTSVEGDGSEGIEALEAKGAAPVSEGEEISMGVKRSSWREEFASLRNDAADPWSARIGADGRESKSSGSVKNEPSASFATPEKKNGSGGGQADTAGVEASPATAEDLASQAGTSWNGFHSKYLPERRRVAGPFALEFQGCLVSQGIVSVSGRA